MNRSKLVSLTVLVCALLCATSAWAQPRSRRGPSATELLVDLEARVTFNEALWSYHDLALIHQIVEGRGETPRERLRWLRFHSGCVSGYRLNQEQARSRLGNCVWTRNLRLDDTLPAGWPYSPGYWRWTVSGRWLEHVGRVRDLVLGRDDYRPCPEVPETWDGVRYGRACTERGEDCPSIMSAAAVARRQASPRRVIDCAVPYTSDPDVEGLHNFGVIDAPPLPPDPPLLAPI